MVHNFPEPAEQERELANTYIVEELSLMWRSGKWSGFQSILRMWHDPLCSIWWWKSKCTCLKVLYCNLKIEKWSPFPDLYLSPDLTFKKRKKISNEPENCWKKRTIILSDTAALWTRVSLIPSHSLVHLLLVAEGLLHYT